MKQVLIVSYMWPPRGGVGLLRVLKFAKYLPEFGWKPVILTATDDAPGRIYNGEGAGFDMTKVEVVKAPYRACAGLLPDSVRALVVYPDLHRGWLKSAVTTGEEMIKSRKIDAVISSSPPETAHLIADSLKRITGVPWIADLRDLWSLCHFGDNRFPRPIINRIIERSVLSRADRVTTVSPGWAKDMSGVLAPKGDNVRVITNGFDEDDFRSCAVSSPKKFTLTYTGKLHSQMQDPDIFFRAVSDCVKDGTIDRDKIDIKFFVLGFQKADITALAKKYAIDDIVKEPGSISYGEAIKEQISASALLFFHWREAPGWYSAKLFEYLGTGNRILGIGDSGSASALLINELKAGTMVSNIDELKKVIVMWYREFLNNGSLAGTVDRSALNRYSRRSTTKELAALLDEVTGRRA